MKRVFVNGTFDILHPGHIELLTFARAQGDRLLVALDSDQRVRQLKGSDRPINSLDIRKQMMLALKAEDCVTDFNSDDELRQIIQQYEPHIMIVGSDYRDRPVIGSEYAQQLVFFDRIGTYSTSKIIQSINDR